MKENAAGVSNRRHDIRTCGRSSTTPTEFTRWPLLAYSVTINSSRDSTACNGTVFRLRKRGFNVPGKRKVRKPAVVQKVIKEPCENPPCPEKAEIAIPEADELYREIRIENKVHDDKGQAAKLKPGAELEVTIEADEKDTIPFCKERHG